MTAFYLILETTKQKRGKGDDTVNKCIDMQFSHRSISVTKLL